MSRVMVDLETLSSGSNAVIIAIGAVVFDEEKLGSTFYTSISRGAQEQLFGRVVSADTVKWWSEQSPEARRVLDDPDAVPLEQALDQFASWLPMNSEIWGYGATFDNVILSNAYAATNKKRPWSYRGDRCFRTLKALFPEIKELPRLGTHHNALDDAVHQARNAQLALRALRTYVVKAIEGTDDAAVVTA